MSTYKTSRRGLLAAGATTFDAVMLEEPGLVRPASGPIEKEEGHAKATVEHKLTLHVIDTYFG